MIKNAAFLLLFGIGVHYCGRNAVGGLSNDSGQSASPTGGRHKIRHRVGLAPGESEPSSDDLPTDRDRADRRNRPADRGCKATCLYDGRFL